MGKGIGGHTLPNQGRSDEWITPPEIIEALGDFDLDPCMSPDQPFDTAATGFTRLDDGLARVWFGRVWLNPPYGKETAAWLAKMAEHDSGTALVFARTETAMFFDHVWPRATAILFLKGRLHFHHPDGSRSTLNAGGPSCLIAYGRGDAAVLQRSGIAGKFIRLK